jgi:hypothetical protein
MKNKKITIADLAGMVKRGFDHVDKRFDSVDNRLDKIENLMLANHRRRIERLETEVRELKELLAVN